MFATVISFEESAEAIDTGIEHVEAEVLPALTGAAGLLNGLWLVDRENGKRLSVIVWENDEAAAAGYQAIEAFRAEHGELSRPVPASVGRYEVYGRL
jgi:hypothetical protein